MVIQDDKKLSKIAFYVIQKLSAAGLLISIFAIFILTSSMELYDFSESMSYWFLWTMIFGYGILSSMVIDCVKIIFHNVPVFIEILLYLIAGFVPFIFIMEPPYILFAGGVGSFSALLFLAGLQFIKRKVTKVLFAFIIPITFLVMANIDFTSKQNWREETTDSSYSVTFDYFNGKHHIPIEAKSGEKIIFSVDFTNVNYGGYGYSILNENKDLIGMVEHTENRGTAIVPEDGIYFIEIRGDNLKGKIEVDWKRHR
ncbi:hypothetical protein [Ornithinibacillus scapharcae]|uniref:hypothetical protein n=1 Tax=Ornithinibacillus scapharcae TaxID=1147159 RepID=UPI000225B8A7|nr:hypothetical protein [Ornithinibacillus scapharcae]